MIEELKNKLKEKYFKFEEQIEIYKNYSNRLTEDEKYKLINEFLEGRDFWGYFQLETQITYELAENSEKYTELLDKISNKVKGDLASGPFFTMLIDIGKEKPEIALNIHKKLIDGSKDNNLKIIAGFILGGYSQKNEEKLKEYMKIDIKYPLTNSVLKAILVKYEKIELTKEVYNYLDKISKCENQDILREYASICLIFYGKDEAYFYDKILHLVKLQNKDISYLIFDRLTYPDILDQKKVFELISHSINSDDFVIDKIIEALRKYPSEVQQISDWLIYWLNRGLELKLRHFDWVLEELVKKNKLFTEYFLKNYKKIGEGKSKAYLFILPHLFKILSKYDVEYALQKIFEIRLEEEEPHLFYELGRVIIGNIYQDSKNKDVLIKLIDQLLTIAKSRHFMSYNKDKYKEKRNKKDFSKQDYDFLIDFTNILLEQLRIRKENYDFGLIKKNIEKYANINYYAKEVLNKAEENKRYTPLLWLGENEEPKLEDIKIDKEDSDLNKALKIDFVRGKFWPRAYLGEMNKDLEIIKKKPNKKFQTKEQLTKNIKNIFSDENKFWTYFSELIFINRFEEKDIKELEPSVPNRIDKHLDLKVNLFGKDIYFEITSPEIDRSLKLANGAVELGNKSFSVIDKKYRQLFSKQTLDEINKSKRDDLFFIVIDINNSVIDEYDLLNSFLGSLSLTMVFDKKTGRMVHEYPSRQKDSLQDKNQNTEIISGAIYFKRELIFVNEEPVIKLKGDIIINPNAKNKLSDEEVNELRKIVFG